MNFIFRSGDFSLMKFVYVVHMGFGEFSQAESFALYTREKGDENIGVSKSRANIPGIGSLKRSRDYAMRIKS
jgi:hypothetical protein